MFARQREKRKAVLKKIKSSWLSLYSSKPPRGGDVNYPRSAFSFDSFDSSDRLLGPDDYAKMLYEEADKIPLVTFKRDHLTGLTFRARGA
jgi:hypothetical protein